MHPVLYYIMLRLFSLIFGNSIITFRLFSIIPLIIMSVLGITHIKKDYGIKTGLLFSFFTYILPTVAIYAIQIRMYTWVMLFVTLMCIYANRLIKQKYILKNYILFSFFSICSSYTHYYGLLTAVIVNVLIFTFFIKNKSIKRKELKAFVIFATIQIAIYFPWIFKLINQFLEVKSGYWIKLEFPETLYNVLGMQFIGNFSNVFGFFFATFFYVYLVYKIFKLKKLGINLKESKKSICIYLSVILIAFFISLKSPILYSRYLMSITGLLIFFISSIIAKENKNIKIILICTVFVIISSVSNYRSIITNYDETNMKQISYLKENIKNEDIIIYQDIGIGSVFAIHFKENKQYFYNKENWNVKEAYEAYLPSMQTVTNLNFLQNYKGRVWLIDYNKNLYNQTFNNLNYVLLDEKNITTKYPSIFDTKYSGYTYDLILLEK